MNEGRIANADRKELCVQTWDRDKQEGVITAAKEDRKEL
jgi:hypothetical protein